MSGVRTEFRKGEMTERNMNDLLRSLWLRVEKLERVRYVEFTFTTDASGDFSQGVTATAPPWPVDSVTVAKLTDTSTGTGFYVAGLSPVWTSADGKLSVNWYQSLNPFTNYTLRLEVRG